MVATAVLSLKAISSRQPLDGLYELQIKMQGEGSGVFETRKK